MPVPRIPALNITSGDELELLWDLFGRQIESVAATTPYITGVGNHEAWYNWSSFAARYPMPSSPFSSVAMATTAAAAASYDGVSDGEGVVTTASPRDITAITATAAAAAAATTTAYNNLDGNHANPPFWFSFNHGLVHVVSLSSEHDYSPSSAQVAWADADLASAAKNVGAVPWIVVAIHRPFYSSDKSEFDAHKPGAPLLAAFEPMMIKYV